MLCRDWFDALLQHYIDDLGQKCGNSSANALELPQSWTKLSILFFVDFQHQLDLLRELLKEALYEDDLQQVSELVE